jgi:hypothetical protein
MSLRDEIEDFVEHRGRREELYRFLDEAISLGGLEGLSCVTLLYSHSFGGFTFNFELKAPAGVAMVLWGEQGVDALVETADKDRTSKNISICIEILSHLAAQEEPYSWIEGSIKAKVRSYFTGNRELGDYARTLLKKFVLSFNDDDDAAFAVGHHISGMNRKIGAAKEVFAALSTRWLAIGEPVLREFEALMRSHGADEPTFQAFLSQHPALLDPMAVQIWPEPSLFGSRRPDFVVRRADDTYLVVEIECPNKTLITGGAQLSAEATHAEMQVADYRTYLMKHYADALQHFPNFDEPDCLAVVGMEVGLNETQKAALRDVNRGRHRTKIVGFDWLSQRARIVADNMTRQNILVSQSRMT